MPRYTSEEYADMHFVYGFCNGNALMAAREYANRYPGRETPYHRTFTNLHRRLRERGTLFPYNGEGPGNVQHNVYNEEEILDLFRQNSTLSTRRAALRLGVNHLTVWRVLNKAHQHPFHLTPVQQLEPADLPRRVEFCRLLLHKEEVDPGYLASILWTDESCFTRDGVTNFHNLHEWNENNPHSKRTSSFQRRFSVNVWCGIIKNKLIGPVFLPPRLNGENYLQFLRTSLQMLLDNVPIINLHNFIYQQDGAPAHYSAPVVEWLNETYPNRWIGRNGPILWPPRSPDLTPLDFYLWGYLKGEVYEVEINTREQLIERIENACAKIRDNLLNTDLIQALTRRLQLCLIQDGGIFENLL